MADQKLIQNFAEQLSTKFNLVQTEVVDTLLKLVKGKSTAQALEIINEINMDVVIGAKTSNIKALYTRAGVDMLVSKGMFAPISEDTLQILLTQSAQYLDGEIAGMSNAVKQQVVSGIMNKRTTTEILESINKKGYGGYVGMKRIVGDGLNNYSRAVSTMMMEEAPDNTKYVYIGPADEKTRGFCLTLISAGAMTQKEIVNNGWGSSLTEGGGVNCRHNWEIASQDSVAQFHEVKEAKELKKDV